MNNHPHKMLGTGTWNDEDHVMLVSNASGTSRVHATKRAHLRKKIAPETHEAAKKAIQTAIASDRRSSAPS